MIAIKREGILLARTDAAFEEEGVLNPAVIRDGNSVIILFRAVARGNRSTIGFARLEGPLDLTERRPTPFFIPDSKAESQGVEDPRVVRIDGLYYLTYTAYDGLNALGSLATSTDLKTFVRHGIIAPKITFDQFIHLAKSTGVVNPKYFRKPRSHGKPDDRALMWDKNFMFFPRRINSRLCFLHRVRPGIQLVSIDNLSDLTPEFWNNYFLHFQNHIVIEPRFDHEASYVGGGCPPIETEKGWLLIYHGVKDTPRGYIYSACAALLDLNDPTIEIARLPYPILLPELKWELYGIVDNVIFPTGTALFDDTLYIYYGAADKCVACASMSLKGLIEELEKSK